LTVGELFVLQEFGDYEVVLLHGDHDCSLMEDIGEVCGSDCLSKVLSALANSSLTDR